MFTFLTFIFQENIKTEKLLAEKVKSTSEKEGDGGEKGDGDTETVEVAGDRVETYTVPRGPSSSYHTGIENMQVDIITRIVHVVYTVHTAPGFPGIFYSFCLIFQGPRKSTEKCFPSCNLLE